ncbi:MAG: nickel-dependent lactate racemase [Clostridia bacterium]|nr:nickel-dependent lactate racemase [Clostridia bacterium]
MKIAFPYGKETILHDFAGENLLACAEAPLKRYVPAESGEELIRKAMLSPEGSPRLSDLARGKKKIVVLISDHTRPVPSKQILPPMLREIREGAPEAEVTLLCATGCHRGTTLEELIAKCGGEIVRRERIVIHDCDDRVNLVPLGMLPSGGLCEINRLAAEADLLAAEGFIEPHFFAGFSGGRKSVLPGIAGRTTVLSNHSSAFIADPASRTGNLAGNPVHRDMLRAAEMAGLSYIVNVVLNDKKEVVFAAAGDPRAAHEKGTRFLSAMAGVTLPEAEVVISTNGGYPLDQNVYQAVKGMTAAEAAVKEGGVIVMLARAEDGIGGDHFFRQLAGEPDGEKLMERFLARSPAETEPDQWQTQILLRVLRKARVILVSGVEDEKVRAMHMIPAHSLPEALALAKTLLGKDRPSITAIPDGVGVIVGTEGKR